MVPAVRENPFQPGAGAQPPLLAGRDWELALAEESLVSLERRRRPSQGLLFYGPRGNGKTVLLTRIADEARRRRMRAERLSAAAFPDHRSLANELQDKTSLTEARVTGLQAAGFGVSVEPGAATTSVAKLLARWIEAEPNPLLILLDEVHTIDAATGRVFFDAVQEATSRALPFWLLVAGTPDAPRRIRDAGTFTERMFEHIPIGRLAREATTRALSGPASDSGLPLTDDAADLLAAESQDYPYFIQVLGSAAWKAANDGGAVEIGERSARKAITVTRPRIERFYASRFNEARRRKVAGVLVPLAAALRDRDGRLGELDVASLLGCLAPQSSHPGDETWLLDTLSDLGVLWRTPAGWEMGIPSFTDYLLGLGRTETRER